MSKVYRKKPPSFIGWLRYMYWWKIRRYDSELCHECGRPYYSSIGDTWWHSDNELWGQVTGGPGGLLCPPCFTRKCKEQGIRIYWEPVVHG